MTKAMLVRAVNAKHALQECVRDTAIGVGKKRRGLHPRGRSHADRCRGESVEHRSRGLAGSHVESPGPLVRRRVTFAAAPR